MIAFDLRKSMQCNILESQFFRNAFRKSYTYGRLIIYYLAYFVRYHLDLCKNIFGEGIYPKVDATNMYYGGDRIAGIWHENRLKYIL